MLLIVLAAYAQHAVASLASRSPSSPSSSARPRQQQRPQQSQQQHHQQQQQQQQPRASMSVPYYIAFHGFDVQTHQVATSDGHVLELHRIVHRRSPPPCSQPARSAARANGASNHPNTKGPVLLIHGLFQSAGVFVSSGRSSLAFHLADAGFDVWLGNNRACTKLHVDHHPSSLAFWDWSLDDLATHDFPTMLEYVAVQTRHAQVSVIGHSQGNAQAFLALLINPKLCRRIRCLVALAPAVFLGPLLKSGPIRHLMSLSPRVYRVVFGVKEFLPIMHPVQAYFPAGVFASLGYHMFSYLFSWSDTNWDRQHKRVYFQFTPRPTSTKAILHWSQMARRGHLGVFDSTLPHAHTDFSTPDILADRLGTISCPIVAFYGRKDLIVDGDRLERECRSQGIPLVYSECIESYEHMDVIWATTAPRRVFDKISAILSRM
ncbi:Alpha/Beta hydrolase protein [Entophlyctis helioformis]|nr:Alpha/Beta hydrolase protein [Entophlyctis helioformis]